MPSRPDATIASRYVIVPCKVEHLYELAETMREADKAEIRALGFGIKKTLWRAFRNSILCKTALVDAKVAAIWGLAVGLRHDVSPLSDLATPWLHTSAAIEAIPVSFLKVAKQELAAMMSLRTRLESWVAADYVQAVKFLRVLGFTVDKAEPFGSSGARFSKFHVERDELPARLAQTRRRRKSGAFKPFIIYTAGRSRTAWLAAFLSYGGARCHQDVAIKFRNMREVAEFFAEAGTGAAETAASPGWRLIEHYVPGIRRVVVRRDTEEVIASSMWRTGALGPVDEYRLRSITEYEARCLEQISRMPGTLTVEFDDLRREDVCREIFEFCLPYEFDRDWWLTLDARNIQVDMHEMIAYYRAHKDEIEQFRRSCKRELIALARAGVLRKAS